MQRTLDCTVSEKEDGLTVKSYLSLSLGLSRRQISRLKANHGISLDERQAVLTEQVHTGQTLHLAFMEQDYGTADILNKAPEILYEDDVLVVVNKPYGISSHASREHPDKHMGTVLKKYYGEDFTVRTVGRLDKDVSGIMVYAKNAETAAALSSDKEEHIFRKQYTAAAEGIFETKKDTLVYKLQKNGSLRKSVVSEAGKECITDYEVIQEYHGISLLAVSIRTGRTHQIRAGMAYTGHPLCGDTLYGGSKTLISRPALHCSRISFIHPETGRTVEISCGLPEDIRKIFGK